MTRTIALTTSLLALAAASASAQTAGGRGDAVDEIVVTAQKREQTLQDVALAVDVVRGEELDAVLANGANILALSGRAPSLYAESSFGRTFPRFYIRGYGNTDFDLNANQPVGFYLDGVVQENPALKGFPVFDTDRVEVLRGPQGTLFGRNTPAGLVKFESRRPTREAEGYASASYGTYDTVDLRAAYGGPLTDTLSFRLSGLYQDRGDVAENLNEQNPEQGIGEFEEYAGRVQLLYEPSDALSILANVHARRQTGGSQVFRANALRPVTGGLVQGFDFETYDQDARHDSELEQLGGVLTITADVGPGELTSVTGYETFEIDARGDVDGGSGAAFLGNSRPGFIPFAAESSDAVTDHGQLTQELRYALPVTDALDLTLGAFYFREDLELENVSYDSLGAPGPDGTPLNGLAVQDQDTETVALFGSATMQATQRLSLTGGLRVSFEDKAFAASRLVTPFAPPGTTLGPLTTDLDDTVLSGDLTAQYDVDADLMAYARYARGFRAPNVQGRILFGDFITVADTETIDSFEVGAKQRFSDGRGRLAVTGYYYTTDDQQLTAVGGAGNFNQLLNADGVEGFGVEVDLAVRPTEWSELTVGYSRNETEIQDAGLTVAACGAPCTVLDPLTADGLALIDGNPLPQAAKHIASATYGASAPVGPGELYLFADAAYRSEVSFFLYESPEFTGEGLFQLGAEVGYRLDGGTEVAGFVRNLTDEVQAVGGVDFNNLTAFTNEPRQWGVRVRAGF